MSICEQWISRKIEIEERIKKDLHYNKKFYVKITHMLDGKPYLIKNREYKHHFNRFIMPKESRVLISLRKILWILQKLSN